MVVVTGFVMTLVGLVQAAVGEPRASTACIEPDADWAVFGPYVNRNHFAGYVVMAIPLALGFAAEAALERLRRRWRARREWAGSPSASRRGMPRSGARRWRRWS